VWRVEGLILWADWLLLLHPIFWLVWLAYWIFHARGVKRTVRHESAVQRLPYTLPLAASLILFFCPRILPFPFLHQRILPAFFSIHRPFHFDEIETTRGHYFIAWMVLIWVSIVLLIAGQFFAVWARDVLGKNWSGTVTVKENHELIQTGPYRLVRHPIYTGLLVAATGSALVQDDLSSVLALALLFVSFWIKLLREEAWMRDTFGEKYDAYCARTKRLVPFVW
jgi:protein-S-isoprenylcysteine O-methyltransferase Ste14